MISAKIDAMRVAADAHDKAMDGFSVLADHFDPATGEPVEGEFGALERCIVSVIDESFDTCPTPAQAMRQALKDLRDMEYELGRVVRALSATPVEPDPEEEEVPA